MFSDLGWIPIGFLLISLLTYYVLFSPGLDLHGFLLKSSFKSVFVFRPGLDSYLFSIKIRNQILYVSALDWIPKGFLFKSIEILKLVFTCLGEGAWGREGAVFNMLWCAFWGRFGRTTFSNSFWD